MSDGLVLIKTATKDQIDGLAKGHDMIIPRELSSAAKSHLGYEFAISERSLEVFADELSGKIVGGNHKIVENNQDLFPVDDDGDGVEDEASPSLISRIMSIFK